MVTIEDYKKQILAKYETDKDVLLLQILQPSPGMLKKWSIYLLDTLDAGDKKIYGSFFNLNSISVKEIKAFDNDRLKPLTNFLNGKSSISDPLGLEFLAILVQFENRPFSKFISTANGSEPKNSVKENVVLGESEMAKELLTVILNEPRAEYSTENNTEKNDEYGPEDIPATIEKYAQPAEQTYYEEKCISSTKENEIENLEYEATIASKNYSEHELPAEDAPEISSKTIESIAIPQKIFVTQNKNKTLNRIAFMAITGILFFWVAYMGVSTWPQERGCMIWKGNHYETVPCDMQVNNFTGEKIIPADKMLLKYQRKIEVSDTTTFFNPDGKPRVFYAKIANDSCEYFTYPGKHPETGKDLKKISQYIIRRYITNKIKK